MQLNRRKFIILAAALPLAAHVEAWAAPYRAENRALEIWRARWNDQKRNRDVPVKIYYPTEGAAPFPIIVFSHGLGGSREGYEYLGRHWAANGYASVHLQHIGSDESLLINRRDLRATLNEAASGRNALMRARDVSFAIEQLEAMNAAEDSPLRNKLDLQQIGMAGHSFGANTTLMTCGMKLVGPRGQGISLREPRIKAAIAMSPPSPKAGDYQATFGAVRLPLFHMTGTKDDSVIMEAGTTAEQRRVAFDNIRGADSYLMILRDGDHMVFSGRNAGNRNEQRDARHHSLILQSSTAFFDAYLRDDVAAQSWLKNQFPKELGEDGTFEQKLVKKK